MFRAIPFATLTAASSLALVLTLGLAGPSSAQSEKETDCRYQADVATAVQQARLDGVDERAVPAAIAARNPAWPARYNNAIPLLAAQFYQMNKRDLKALDMGSEWFKACLSMN